MGWDIEYMLLKELEHNLSIGVVSNDTGEIIAGLTAIIGAKYEPPRGKTNNVVSEQV